jgi:hypothetical protein
LPLSGAKVSVKEAIMPHLLSEANLKSVIWRNRDGGGIATFVFENGPVTSRPMSHAGAWQAAVEAFDDDCVLEERFDGGRRWTRPGSEPDGRPYR